MIDPLNVKKIGPVRLQPEMTGERQVKTEGGATGVRASSDSAQPQLLSLASEAASEGAPVDRSRAGELSEAIGNGNYKVEPSRIAAAMLDFALAGKDRS